MSEKHPCDPSQLQALADHQLPVQETEELKQHLAECGICRNQFESILEDSKSMAQYLHPAIERKQIPIEKVPSEEEQVYAAWDLFQSRLAGEPSSTKWEKLQEQKQNKSLTSVQLESGQTPGEADLFIGYNGLNGFKGIESSLTVNRLSPNFSSDEISSSKKTFRLGRKWTRVAAGAAIAVLATGVFATNIGNKALASMLQTFRVQHLTTVNADDLSKLQQELRSNNGTFDLKQYGQIEEKGAIETKTVTLAEAEQLTGHSLKVLPGTSAHELNKTQGLNNTQTSSMYFTYSSGTDVVFRLKVDQINQLLHRLGGKSDFPSSINDQPITLHVPATIHQTKIDPQKQDSYMSLEQFQAPSLDVSNNADIAQVRKALLDLPFLPDTMRQPLLSSKDWKQTLIVPSVQGQYQNVSVNGNEGVMSTNPNNLMVMWLQDGWVYTVNAQPNALAPNQTILDVAKEIAK